MKRKNRIAALLLSVVFLMQCTMPVWAEDTLQETLPSMEQSGAETGLGIGVFQDTNEVIDNTDETEAPAGEDDPNGDGTGEDDPDGDGTGENDPNGDGTGEDDPNGDGTGEDDPNGDGTGEDDPNGDGTGEDDPNGDGTGEDNPNGDGTGEDDPNGDGTGEDDPNGDGTGEDDPNGDGTGEDDPNGDGTGEDDPNGDGTGENDPDGELEEEPPALPEWYDPEADEYQLDSAEMLAELAQLSAQESFAGKTIVLTQDLSGVVLTAPIGTGENPFQGAFDGGWHTISFDQSQAAPCGLFGVMENAQVSNLHLSGLWVSSDEASFGALAASMTGTVVSQVWLEDITLEGNGPGGAMAGRAEDSSFCGCLVKGLRGDQMVGSYLYYCTGAMSFERCYAAQCGRRRVVLDTDALGTASNCVQDGTSMDFYLGFAAFYDQNAAVYQLNQGLEEPLWAVEDGAAAPRGFLTEAAKAPSKVSVTLQDIASQGTLTVNGATASYGYNGYCFPEDQLVLSYQQPKLPYQTVMEIQCSDPERLTALEEGGWQYTCTGGDVEITISLTVTGGYDISWYLGHEYEGAFYVSTPEQMVGLSLLVIGNVPEVSGPVSFAGTVIYLTNDVTLPENWQSIGNTSAPFSGGFESLNPAPEEGEETEPEADGDGGAETADPMSAKYTVTLSDAPLFGTLTEARVANLHLDGEESLGFCPLAQTASNTELENCASSADVDFQGYTGTGGLVSSMTGGRMISCSVSGSISGGSYIGGLAGRLSGTELISCSFSGSLSGTSYAGGLAGMASSSQFTDCTASGAVSGTGYAGGLAGTLSSSQLTGCSNFCQVHSTGSYAGGLAGQANGSQLTDCSNFGQVHAAGNYTGGLAGVTQNNSQIQNGKNTGKVICDGQFAGGLTGYSTSLTISGGMSSGAVSSQKEFAGGIVGYLSAGSLTDCVNTGPVQSGPQCAGGIVGHLSKAAVESCRNEGEVSGTNWVGGVAGYVTGGQLTNCENKSSTVSGSSYVGGVAGSVLEKSTLTDCRNTSETLTAEGGVAGQVKNSTLTRCSNSAALTGGASYIGGIAGQATDVTAQDCVNTGAVTSESRWTTVSGCFGQLDGTSMLTSCENTGDITGSGPASGIANLNHVSYSAATISLNAIGCVNRGTVSGGETAGGLFNSPNSSTSGLNVGGNVVRCANYGDVSAANVAGGIASFGYRLALTSCCNEGDISLKTGAYTYMIKSVGGLLGHSQGQAVDCLNTGTVSAPTDAVALSGAGGIIGTAEGSGRASGCLNLGQVSGSSLLYTGAVTGRGFSRSYNCFSGPDTPDGSSDSGHVTILTEEQLTSGEGAWMLNKSSSSWLSFGWSQDDELGHPVPAKDASSAIRKLTVSISGDGTVSGVPEGMYLAQGTRFSLLPVPGEGMMVTRFRFGNTDLRGQEIPEGGIPCVMPSQDCTLEIQFGPLPTQETYTVTFDPQNGEAAAVQTVQAGKNAPHPETEPQWEGHYFRGWYTQPAGGEIYSFDEAITADLTLYAHWGSEMNCTPFVRQVWYTI